MEKRFLYRYAILLLYIIINLIYKNRFLLLVKDLFIETYRFVFNKLNTLYISLFTVFIIYYLIYLLNVVILFWVSVIAYIIAV